VAATRPSAWCGSLAVWQPGTCSWQPHNLAAVSRCCISLLYLAAVPRTQYLEARPRDAEAAATRFRTTGAFLSSPRIAPGHQVLHSRLEQTPPSAVLHSATFNIAAVCGTFGHLSLPSSFVWGLGRKQLVRPASRKVPPYGVQPAKTRRRVPKRSSYRANDTWQGKASD
jgi:hypothetical protein